MLIAKKTVLHLLVYQDIWLSGKEIENGEIEAAEVLLGK